MANLGAIQVGALAASNLALVIPALLGGQPKGYTPIPGVNPDGSYQPIETAFLFHYEGENKVSMESDITDHYVETNSAIQDSITLHPKTISVHGFIGELNNVPDSSLFGSILGAAKTVKDKLQGVSAYAPKISTTATNVYNASAQAYSTLNSVRSSATAVFDAITGKDPTLGAQATAYLQLEKWRDNRRLFTIQTPWKVYNYFAILSLTPTQDERTNTVTDFSIVFKEMKFASTNILTGGLIPSISSTTIIAPTVGSPISNQSLAQVVPVPPTSGAVPGQLPGTLFA